MVKKPESKEDKILFGIERIMQKLTEHDARFDAHDKRFDAHDKRFDAHDKRFDAHDKRFDAHDKRFDAHDKRFDEQNGRFDRIEAAVLETNLNVKSLAVKLERVDQKIDMAVTNHESRIRKLEHKVGA